MNTFTAGGLLTVTVLASISVNMNSPPSKSSFIYRRALQAERQNHMYTFRAMSLYNIEATWSSQQPGQEGFLLLRTLK